MPSTKVLLTAAALCFLVALAVPTAAITVGEDPATDDVVLEPVDTRHASIENGQLELSVNAYGDNARTIVDVFTISVGEDADDLEQVWIEHDVDGVHFYADGNPGAQITTESRLEPAPGDVVRVGVTVDSRLAQAGTETFTIHVLYEDDVEDGPAETPDGEDGPDEVDPAAIELIDLEVTPAEPRAGDTLEVTATYENTGGASGETVAELVVGGTVVDAGTVTVPAGERESITFEWTPAAAGTYTLEVGSETATVTVAEPDEPLPEIEVTEVDLEAEELELGEAVVVTATLENRGNATGETTAELEVGGGVVDAETVALEPDEAVTVTLEWLPGQPGSYEVAVNGVEAGTVTVSDDGTPVTTVTERVLMSPTTAVVAPPLAAGLLLLIPVVRRHRDVWDPRWTDERRD